MNAVIARALISCLAVSFGLSVVQADDEKPQRLTERDIVKQRVEVFRIALKGLLEAEKEDAADVIQRAIRAREVMLEGRRDDEAHRIREKAPNIEQLARVLQMASEVWREFDNEDRATTVGRLAKELAEQAERRQRGRERAERSGRPTEREIVLRRIEVMRMSLPALREGERGDAVEILERAIRAYEVGLEGRRDKEAQKIRERMPKRGHLAEALLLSSNLWREFENQDKAEIVGELAKELANREREAARESENRNDVIGFNGEVRGIVLEKGRENTIGFKVARVIRVWPKVNKAKNPEALAGKTVVIGPANDLHAKFLSKLTPRQEVTLEIRGGERNRFVITELTQQQRDMAKAD